MRDQRYYSALYCFVSCELNLFQVPLKMHNRSLDWTARSSGGPSSETCCALTQFSSCIYKLEMLRGLSSLNSLESTINSWRVNSCPDPKCVGMLTPLMVFILQSFYFNLSSPGTWVTGSSIMRCLVHTGICLTDTIGRIWRFNCPLVALLA